MKITEQMREQIAAIYALFERWCEHHDLGLTEILDIDEAAIYFTYDEATCSCCRETIQGSVTWTELEDFSLTP